jgi:hypothetical protein
MDPSEPFLDLHFLGLRIMLQPFDPPFLVFDITAQVRVFFLQHSDLMALFAESGKPLGSSEHDGCVGRKSHQSSESCDGP